MPLAIVRAISTEGSSCYLQSFVAVQISGNQDGNLLRVVNSGEQASVDFKGKTLSSQTKFLFKKLTSTGANIRDMRVQLQWQENKDCYLAASGKSLVIESTSHLSQPKFEFIVEKARPSHAFMFKNTACLDQSFAYINSDEKGRVFMGPGSNDNPQAWVNVVFPDRNYNATLNTIDGISAPAHTKYLGDINSSPNNNGVVKLWKATTKRTFCEMLSYV